MKIITNSLYKLFKLKKCKKQHYVYCDDNDMSIRKHYMIIYNKVLDKRAILAHYPPTYKFPCLEKQIRHRYNTILSDQTLSQLLSCKICNIFWKYILHNISGMMILHHFFREMSDYLICFIYRYHPCSYNNNFDNN